MRQSLGNLLGAQQLASGKQDGFSTADTLDQRFAGAFGQGLFGTTIGKRQLRNRVAFCFRSVVSHQVLLKRLHLCPLPV